VQVNSGPLRACLLLSLFFLNLKVAVTQETRSLAIEHVTVIDVVSGTSAPDMTVLVTGNRIARVVASAAFVPPAKARRIDGHGKFLIPGLWDMHVHLGNATEAALPMFVASGITGVRDMGSPSFATLRQWSVQALSGERIGPRIVAAGPQLTEGPPYFWQMQVRNAAEGRRAVDELAEEGVDFIKVTQSLDRDTYFAIADEARKLDLPLAGHVPINDNGVGYRVSGVEASNAGQKCLEHSLGIPLPIDEQDPALVPTLLKNHTWVDPTLITYWARAHVYELAAKQDDPRLTHVSPALKQFWAGQMADYPKKTDIQLQVFKWRLAQVTELHKAGVPLLAGTDLGFAYIVPGDVRKELELFVEAGLSPLDALRTATINPAKYLNKDNELGSIEEAKIADLVLLDADPLTDIRSLYQVRAVVLNGRFLDHEQLDTVAPVFK
jgi:Amidohydrolase family